MGPLFGLIFLVLFIVWIIKRTRKPDQFPPGPPRLPIVGSAPYLRGSEGINLFHGAINLTKKYGPVVGFYMGSSPFVLLTNFEDMKEMFKLDALSSRPNMRPNNELRPGWKTVEAFDPPLNEGRAPGVIVSSGSYWKEQRRFVLRHLRDFGFGKTSMEETLQDEVQKLNASWRKKTGQPFQLNRSANISILNALWGILVGEKLELDNPKLENIVLLFDQMFRASEGFQSPLVQLLPSPQMAKWPIIRDMTDFAIGKQTFEQLDAFIEPYIEEHKATLDPDNVRDFMDQMLLEIQNTSDPQSSFYGITGHYALFNNMIDLFIAGMETTSSSLLWTFLYLLHHPEVQQKIHQEIDEVIGKNRPPSLDDKSQLHYVNAVLLESFRVTSFVPLGVPHYSTADVKIHNHVIPKGTTVFASLYHVMYDPEYFEDPATFNPDRFIDKSTGQFVNCDRVVPFSFGKRYCLGQSLAEKEFFLFFTGIMQQFEMALAPGTELPKYGVYDSPCKGIVRNAPDYQVVLTNRMA